MTQASERGTKADRREQRRGEIVDAAREVFLRKGFERSSVSEIADVVGTVEGNVFRYFPTKRDLLNEVLQHMYEPLIADVAAGFARITGLRGRIRFIVWRHIRVYTESPGLARLVLHEVRTAQDYHTSLLHDLQLQYTDVLRQALEQAVADSEISEEVDFEMVRSVLYGGLEHMMWPLLHSKRKVNAEHLADHFTDIVLHGIDGPAGYTGIESRLTRLEGLVTPPAVKKKRARSSASGTP